MMSTLELTLIGIASAATLMYIYKFVKTKRPVFFINLVLVYAILFLSYSLITGIEAPIKFEKEREYRYSFVIERLKDIRTAELAYKDEFGVFSGNFDELIKFVNNDSVRVVRKLGTLPDTLTEQMAVDMGLTISQLPAKINKRRVKKVLNKTIKKDFEVTVEEGLQEALDLGFLIRDTIKTPVKETIFKNKGGVKFNADSLRYVPFSKTGAQFKLAAGEIETASKVKVQVFEAEDTDPFDPNKVLKVGSLTEATNNAGNWE